MNAAGAARPAAGRSGRARLRGTRPGSAVGVRPDLRLDEERLHHRGDSYDNALAESVIGLFKAELDRQPGSVAHARASRAGAGQIGVVVARRAASHGLWRRPARRVRRGVLATPGGAYRRGLNPSPRVSTNLRAHQSPASCCSVVARRLRSRVLFLVRTEQVVDCSVVARGIGRVRLGTLLRCFCHIALRVRLGWGLHGDAVSRR